MEKLIKISRRSGLTFLLVLVLVLVIAISIAGFVRLMNNEILVARHQNDSTRAFYVAEAGVESGVAWLRSQLIPPASAQGPIAGSLAVMGDTGSFTYTVTPDADNPTSPAPGIYAYTIASTGIVRGASRTIRTAEAITLSTFARYSYFTSYESFLVWWWWWQLEVPVWFTTGTFLEGPVHTNDQFHISGNPIFDGPVSCAAATIDYMHGGPPNDNPDFRQGITFGADEIDTESLTANTLTTAAASEGGYTFEGNTAVTLRDDGTIDVINYGGTSDPDPPPENMPLPANGALFVNNGDLLISGTLDGVLTAGASRDVIIMDDIRYNEDPRTVPTSDDILALISERDIVVDSNAANGDPERDLEVFASVIAIGQEPAYSDEDGSFYVENYWSGLRGVLTVHGGIIQKRRGPVGTFYSSNNQKASGYDKDYHYDMRMETNPPPHLPRITSFGRSSWQETP